MKSLLRIQAMCFPFPLPSVLLCGCAGDLRTRQLAAEPPCLLRSSRGIYIYIWGGENLSGFEVIVMHRLTVEGRTSDRGSLIQGASEGAGNTAVRI